MISPPGPGYASVMTNQVLESVDVDVPVRTAYNQWTQFESFPSFMNAVERIDQLSETRTHWVTKIAGVEREFDAEITEQTPDERIAWKTLDGPDQAGVVTFHRIGDDRSRVTLQLDFDPEGFAEKAGSLLGIVQAQIKSDLKSFKEFIENGDGSAVGGWRGDVESPSQSGVSSATTP
jgi:uncharacterized membrane protein